MAEHETVTIKKSTMRNMTIALVVLLLVVSFAGGYMIGGAGKSTGALTAGSGGTILQPSQQAAPSGQQAAPSRVSVSADDDPSKGDANAAVTVIEFSDFQCPFCRKFYTDTLQQVEDNYVDTGKVRFVYRDFPLDSIHPAARPAAIAAECADEQGKFWEYHNKIFDEQNKQGAGTVQFGDTELKKWASEIGLSTASFNSCLDSNKYDSEVSADFQDGVSAGVSGTPTFYIGNDQDGYTQIVGAQPYSVIKSAVDSALSA